MNYIIYTYSGHADLVAQVFNAIARIFATESPYYTAIAPFALCIGGVWAATRAIFHANIGIFAKSWFLPTFLAITFLFSPKQTVLIKDTATRESYSIANIPFVVAFFSAVPSQVSHYLAREIEDQFATPQAARASNSGLMFGAKLIASLKDVKMQDPVLLHETKEFLNQCFIDPWIMGNLLGKKAEAESTSDVFSWLKANQARCFGMYVTNETGRRVFKTCDELTDPLLKKIEDHAKSTKVLATIAAGLGLSCGKRTDLKRMALMCNVIGSGGLKSLERENSSVHHWVRQSMMLNAYREGLDDSREGLGLERLWPKLLSMNAARGMAQQSMGWMTAGEMAAQFLPLMQTMLFLILVSSIFVVFPLALLPGGSQTLAIWIKALIWVHTWPIFFAIINSIGLSILASKTNAFGGEYGMDKLTQEPYSQMLVHSFAIIQLFAASIPMFSWMLISKSGMAFANMAQNMSPLSTAGALGASSADNTLSMDNVNMGNRSMNQQQLGPNMDLSSSFNTGSLRVTQSPEGQEFLTQSASNLSTNYRGSAMASKALNDSYSRQESHMEALSFREGKLQSQEASQLRDSAQRWMQSDDASHSVGDRTAQAMRIVASSGSTSGTSSSSRASEGVDLSAGLGLSASGAGAGGIAGGRAGVGTRHGYDVSKDHSASETMSHSEAQDHAREYFKSQDQRSSSGESHHASSGLSQTWREQNQVAKDQATTLQNMHSIQNSIAQVSQNSHSIDSNLNDQLMERVAQENNFSTKQEALQYMDKNPGKASSTLNSIAQEMYGDSRYEMPSSLKEASISPAQESKMESKMVDKGVTIQKGYNAGKNDHDDEIQGLKIHKEPKSDLLENENFKPEDFDRYQSNTQSTNEKRREENSQAITRQGLNKLKSIFVDEEKQDPNAPLAHSRLTKQKTDKPEPPEGENK